MTKTKDKDPRVNTRKFWRTPWTRAQVLERGSILLFCAGILGIAFKFSTYWNHWVYFPLWPNICDSLFLIVGALVLAYKALRAS